MSPPVENPLAAAVGPTKPNGVQLGVGLTCPSPELAQIPTPFDLAVNMGFSDGPGHPEVQEALAQAWQKIADKGLRLSSFVVTPEQGRAALDRGVQLLFLGFDTMFIPGAIDNYLRLLNPST